MKELTIEQKARRYDEILARAEEANISQYKEFVDYLIPELKEGNDERIRKKLISYFSNVPGFSSLEYNYGITQEEAVAWLEKQGEQKTVKFMTKSYITPNPEFFQWIYDRLVYQHHEDPNMDYMHSLKERIEDMQEIVNVKADNILVKQNPTWSEEDERLIKFLIAHFSVSHPYSSFKFDINTDLTTDEIIERIRNLRPQSRRRQPKSRKERKENKV